MQRFLRENGLRTQAVPEQLELVDVIPRNPASKINRAKASRFSQRQRPADRL